MKIAILGAGPSGLTAAQELTAQGINVDVYEKDNKIGGLAKCLNMWGQLVEIGPHFLAYSAQDVNILLKDLIPNGLCHINRKSSIYLNGKFYDYPPYIFNIAKNIGINKSVIAISSAISKMIFPTKNSGTVESYVKNRIGNYLYEFIFKEYTEKLWGIPCDSISEEYAKALIGFESFNISTIFRKIINTKNIKLHRNYIYPKQGMDKIWMALKDKIENQGGNIHLSTQINSLLVDNMQINGVIMPDGEIRRYDYIISSIPETIIASMLPNIPEELTEEIKKIQFRSVLIIYIQLENTKFIDGQTIYIFNKNAKTVRITNYNSFHNIEGNDIIALEYWVSDKEEMYDFTPEQMFELAKLDLQTIPNGNKLRIKNYNMVKIKKAYTIPDMKFIYRHLLLSTFINQYKGFSSIGRANKSWFNFDMECAMLDGITIARHIINNI